MKPLLGRIEQAMKAAGVRKADVARALDISPGTVSDWFKKDSLPSAEILSQLPGALGVSGHWLLTGIGPQKPVAADSAQAKLERIRRIIDATDAGADAAEGEELPVPVVGGEAARSIAQREAVNQTPAGKPGAGKVKRRARGSGG